MRQRVGTVIAAAAAAAAFVAGAPAPASAQIDLGTPPAQPNDLTSSSVVFMAGKPVGVYERGARGKRRLRQFDPVLRRIKPPRTGETRTRDFTLGASSKFVILGITTASETSDEEDPAEAEVDLGPTTVVVAPRRGGRVKQLVRCRSRRVGPVQANGSVLAYQGARCRDRIEVVDMATGRTRLFGPANGFVRRLLHVAGRYIAVRERRPYTDPNFEQRIAVYNWHTGRRLYTAPLGISSDLAADGTLAVAGPQGSPECAATHVAWYSPAEPRPHVLPGACTYKVFVAEDRLLWGRASPAGGQRSEFVVTDLRTGSTTPPLFTSDLRNGTPSYFDAGPVYFSGRRIGYYARGCTPRRDFGRLVIDYVADLQKRGPYRPRC